MGADPDSQTSEEETFPCQVEDNPVEALASKTIIMAKGHRGKSASTTAANGPNKASAPTSDKENINDTQNSQKGRGRNRNEKPRIIQVSLKLAFRFEIFHVFMF